MISILMLYQSHLYSISSNCQMVPLLWSSRNPVSLLSSEPKWLLVVHIDIVVYPMTCYGLPLFFFEGKRCQNMTKSPVGFKMDWNSCYVTDYLDFGRTSSLLFDQAGTFKYEVEFKSTSSPTGAARIGLAKIGTIIVE